MSNTAGSGPLGAGGQGGGRPPGDPASESPGARAVAMIERSRPGLEARGLGAISDGLQAVVEALERRPPAETARALHRVLQIAEELREDAPCKSRLLNLLARLAGEAGPSQAKRAVDVLAEAIVDRMPG